ncbi:MAG TPA: hypothetical protein VI122_11875 [Thermoleophilaceae bacterium]|jgi:hypothetical protein
MIQAMIRWPINPFRGDRFAEEWLPAAEAVLDYGATEWTFTRAMDGRLDFIQTAVFPSKADFERYWYSEEISEKRVEIAGIYQVPIVPTFWEVVGAGEAEELSAPGRE